MTTIRVSPEMLAAEGREMERIASQIRDLENRIANSYARVSWEARRRTPIEAIVGQVRQRARQVSVESERLGRGLGQLSQSFLRVDEQAGSKITSSMGPLSQKSQAFTTGPGMALAFPREELSAQLRVGVPGATPGSAIGAIPALGAIGTGALGVAGAVGSGVLGLGGPAGSAAKTFIGGGARAGMAAGAAGVTGAFTAFGAWAAKNSRDIAKDVVMGLGEKAVEVAVGGRMNAPKGFPKSLVINMQGGHAKVLSVGGHTLTKKAAFRFGSGLLTPVMVAADVVVAGTDAYYHNVNNPNYDGSDLAAATVVDGALNYVPSGIALGVGIGLGLALGPGLIATVAVVGTAAVVGIGADFIWDEWGRAAWQQSGIREKVIRGGSHAIDQGAALVELTTNGVKETAAKVNASVAEGGKQVVEAVQHKAAEVGRGIGKAAQKVADLWKW